VGYYLPSRRKRNSLTAIGYGQLADDVTEVKVNRTFGDAKFNANVSARKTMGCHAQALNLALTQGCSTLKRGNASRDDASCENGMNVYCQ
jgi:hypothetical protein